MQQRKTAVNQEYHNQFQDTPDEIKMSKWEKAERLRKDEKQGQSDFRVKKKIKK